MLKLRLKKLLYSKLFLVKKNHFKKLVLIILTFTFVTVISKKDIILDYVLYIYYIF